MVAVLAKLRGNAATPDYPLDVDMIPRIYDDPRYVEKADLLSKFSRFMERLERARLQLVLERELSDKAPDPRSTSDTALRAKLAELRAEPPLAPEAPSAAPATASAAIHRGVQILNGETVAALPNHASRLAELDRLRDSMHDAVIEQTEAVDHIAVELTYEYAAPFDPAWKALQLQYYREGQQLSRTTTRIRALRAAFTANGFRPRSDVFVTPNVRGPLIIGDESAWNSEISEWRKTVERLGILK
jgi:hypothetical protein